MLKNTMLLVGVILTIFLILVGFFVFESRKFRTTKMLIHQKNEVTISPSPTSVSQNQQADQNQQLSPDQKSLRDWFNRDFFSQNLSFQKTVNTYSLSNIQVVTLPTSDFIWYLQYDEPQNQAGTANSHLYLLTKNYWTEIHFGKANSCGLGSITNIENNVFIVGACGACVPGTDGCFPDPMLGLYKLTNGQQIPFTDPHHLLQTTVAKSVLTSDGNLHLFSEDAKQGPLVFGHSSVFQIHYGNRGEDVGHGPVNLDTAIFSARTGQLVRFLSLEDL